MGTQQNRLNVAQERQLRQFINTLRQPDPWVDVRLLKDHMVVDAFLRKVGTRKVQLSLTILTQVGLFDEIKTGIQRLWWGVSVFSNDAEFSSDRFLLLTADWWGPVPEARHQVDDNRWHAATRQLVRMFAVGRVDRPRVNHFTNGIFKAVKEDLPLPLAAQIMAYQDDEFIRFTRTYLDQLHRENKHGYYWRDPAYVDDLLTMQATIRAELFRDNWLPAAIGAAEHASVKHLPTTLLQDMYPSIWLAGYDGYRERILHTAHINRGK